MSGLSKMLNRQNQHWTVLGLCVQEEGGTFKIYSKVSLKQRIGESTALEVKRMFSQIQAQ